MNSKLSYVPCKQTEQRPSSESPCLTRFLRRVSDYDEEPLSSHSCLLGKSEVPQSPALVSDEEESSRGTKRRRNVSFAAENNVRNDAIQYLEQEDQEQLWYNREELSSMKLRAKRLCCRRPDLELPLEDVYYNSQDGDSQDGASPDAVSTDECSTLLQIPFFEEQRGLERWSSKRLSMSRALTILSVKTEVFVGQAKKSFGNSKGKEEVETDASDLAAVCRRASAPSARYARLLGEIDAAIASSIEKDH